MARSAGVDNLQLYVMPVPTHSCRRDIDQNRFHLLEQRFLENYPSVNEGWTEVRQGQLELQHETSRESISHVREESIHWDDR